MFLQVQEEIKTKALFFFFHTCPMEIFKFHNYEKTILEKPRPS